MKTTDEDGIVVEKALCFERGQSYYVEFAEGISRVELKKHCDTLREFGKMNDIAFLMARHGMITKIGIKEQSEKER